MFTLTASKSSSTRASLTSYSYETESGATTELSRCAKCGTTVSWTISSGALSHMVAIAGATFDPPTFWYDVEREVFTRSKAEFCQISVPGSFDESPIYKPVRRDSGHPKRGSLIYTSPNSCRLSYFLHPTHPNIQPITLSNAFGGPATNCIHNIRRTLYFPQPVSQAVPKRVNYASVWNSWALTICSTLRWHYLNCILLLCSTSGTRSHYLYF